MFLPYWNSELYVEISSCFPLGKDYQPVSINKFYDENLRNLASLCMDLDSEFFFMASPFIGCVGNLPRENFFRYTPDNVFNLGFLMLLSYSEKIEKALIVSLAFEHEKNLLAGVSKCSFWRKGVFEGNTKVIAIVSDDPFYDCTEYLKRLTDTLAIVKKSLRASDSSYYAEKFGYDRFFIPWENENPYELRVSQLISEFEYENTKEIVGGSTRIEFPQFLGITIRAIEHS